MDKAEARRILQSCRPDETDLSHPQVAEALETVATDPELASWFSEEQAFDRAIAAHLAAVPAPLGLKTRILAHAPPAPQSWWRSLWPAPLVALAVLLAVLLQVAGFWGPANTRSAGEAADFSREMVSFIQLPPNLEMKSDDLGAIKRYLVEKETRPAEVPERIAALAPLGCRVLSFRGHDVTLICFRREGDQPAHLFVLDRGALPKIKPGARPIFANVHGWLTATWAEGDRVYMLAMQGARADAEKYLPNA